MSKQLNEIAERNLQALRANPYPGRGIVLGVDSIGKNMVQIYWIMGRSENSRNRILKSESSRLFTEAADPAKMQDPKLIIYNAMGTTHTDHVVSNGEHTGIIIDGLRAGQNFSGTLSGLCSEPDAPHFTPRIAGVWMRFGMHYPAANLGIIRRSEWGDGCNRFCYRYEAMCPGFGYCIHTYAGDGDPLPSFEGEPMLVSLQGDIKNIAAFYWQKLNGANLVSLAVKFIPLDWSNPTIEIINKYSKVG